MSIFGRVRTLVQARIQDIREEMEDPMAVIDEAIDDLDGSLVACRRQATDARGVCRLLELRLQEASEARDRRQEDAQRALDDGNEPLAREAIRRRLDLEQRVALLDQQLTEARRLSEQLQADLSTYESKLLEARTRRDLLLTRTRAAELRQQVAAQSARLDGIDSGHGVEAVSRAVIACEENLLRMNALSDSVRELAGPAGTAAFERLRVEQRLDDELAALKDAASPAKAKPSRKRRSPSKRED